MNKLELLIEEKQAEWRVLNEQLDDALTGIESPDYERAGRIQPLIYAVRTEIERLLKLREVTDTVEDFSTRLSRLLTDDGVTCLEVWTQIKDYWNDVTVRLLEIRKAKAGYAVSCTLRLTEPLQMHLHADYTAEQLQHLGWTAGRGGKSFWYKAKIKNPDQFDIFHRHIAVTVLEALGSLWGHGQQYFRFR